MLDPELQSLLRRNLELTKENNRLLLSMRRMTFWGGIFKFFVWILLIIVIPAIAYYWYLAPHIETLMAGVNQMEGMRASLESNDSFSQLKEWYEQYQSSRQ